MGVDAEMLVKTKAPCTEKQVRRWAYEISSAFWGSPFWIDRDNGRHCLVITNEYTQDGDSIFPVPGETFIQVNLFCRYYGVGYERGPLPELIAVAEYLEKKVPESKIFYGGDSFGICAVPFDKREREILFAHFVEYGHAPYVGSAGSLGSGIPPFCTFCDEPMIQNGFGGSYARYFCSGCRYVIEDRDGVRTYKKEK